MATGKVRRTKTASHPLQGYLILMLTTAFLTLFCTFYLQQNMHLLNDLSFDLNIEDSGFFEGGILISDHESQQETVKVLENEKNYLFQEVNSMATVMEKLEQNVWEKEKIISSLQQQIDVQKRAPASVDLDYRSAIAQHLSKKLNKISPYFKVNQDTGIATLQLNQQRPFFKRSSDQLTKSAKSLLKKLVPAYASALFSLKGAKDNIKDIYITGHASPSYGQKYVDPKHSSSKAYHFNLDLSTNRAKSIVKYLTGTKIGNYSNKAALKSFFIPSGKSFSRPILRSPSSKNNGCGDYDCALSRRIEISFSIK